jgi:LmbE family N-acetylglucosaminyl deacetylase
MLAGDLPRAERVLVVGAHPDDPDFFCAGTVARWTDSGTAVWYLVVTLGQKGVLPGTDPATFGRTRESEQRDAAKLLGVEGVTFLEHVDGEVFDTLELRGQITEVIRRFRPQLIATHDPLTRLYRQHPDHRAVGFAAMHAAFPASRLATFFPDQMDLGLQPHPVLGALLFGSDRPDTFVDIAPVFERKVAALQAHVSQTSAFPGGLHDRVRSRAEEAGREAGVALAEAFLSVVLE